MVTLALSVTAPVRVPIVSSVKSCRSGALHSAFPGGGLSVAVGGRVLGGTVIAVGGAVGGTVLGETVVAVGGPEGGTVFGEAVVAVGGAEGGIVLGELVMEVGDVEGEWVGAWEGAAVKAPAVTATISSMARSMPQALLTSFKVAARSPVIAVSMTHSSTLSEQRAPHCRFTSDAFMPLSCITSCARRLPIGSA